jgi:hypothetical protein
LEVEPASNRIDVENLTRDVEIGQFFAFHGFEIHLLQIHAARRDELLFESAFSCHIHLAAAQIFYDFLHFFVVDIG